MKIFLLSLILLFSTPYRSISQDTVVLKPYIGNLKQIDISIGGRHFNFLFDSGGGETLVSTEVANFLERPIYGNETGFRMTGEMINYQKCDSVSLKIGSTTIFHESVGVWDIMKILPKELPKLDGVLSLKSFNNKIVSLDLFNNRIIFETFASYRKKLNQMILVKSRFANGQSGNEVTLLLGIPQFNHLYWFLFDSGNLDNVLLSHSTAKEWSLQSDTVTQRIKLGELTIPIGTRQIQAEASSTKLIYDGSLNYSIISRFIFLINFPKRQVWVN